MPNRRCLTMLFVLSLVHSVIGGESASADTVLWYNGDMITSTDNPGRGGTSNGVSPDVGRVEIHDDQPFPNRPVLCICLVAWPLAQFVASENRLAKP